MLPDSRNWIAFRILRYTFLPKETALMIVAKLSSARIIAAASLETSVPVIPMATPMSAFLRAGASLTPSPVMAVILPLRCHASTIRILFSGDTRAYTDTFSSTLSSSLSDRASTSCPVRATSPSWKIPICLAIAAAVTLWSPVIITVLIPALSASATAFLDSSLGGSIMAVRPTKVKSFSSSRESVSSSSTSLIAKARTRRPFSEKCWFCFKISFLSSSVISRTSFSIMI